MVPRDCNDAAPTGTFDHIRTTFVDGQEEPITDDWVKELKDGEWDQGGWWNGRTVFTCQGGEDEEVETDSECICIGR